VLAVPATGTDSAGNEVRGYFFEVSGSGTAVISGRVKNSELFDRVTQLAEHAGQPIRVMTWRRDYRGQERTTGSDNRTPAAR
jgi:hypothetical protein